MCWHCGTDFRTGFSPVRATKVNGLAIASLVLGIVPLLGIGSVVAVVFGHVALGQIKRSNGFETGRGMALAGLILGYAWIVLNVLLLVAVVAFAFLHAPPVEGGVSV